MFDELAGFAVVVLDVYAWREAVVLAACRYAVDGEEEVVGICCRSCFLSFRLCFNYGQSYSGGVYMQDNCLQIPTFMKNCRKN